MRKIEPTTELPAAQKISVPGSKSYSNRALLLAALADGTSRLEGILESEDTMVMLKALRTLGVRINKKAPGTYEVQGSSGGFNKPKTTLNLENAGTAVRSLTAALSIQPFRSTITGNKRMCERPIADLVEALKPLGASITATKGCPPITTKGPLKGGKTSISGSVSSQYISALLMAAPYAQSTTTINVKGALTSLPYVTMTLSTMKAFGVNVKNEKNRRFTIKPKIYTAANYQVEGDASSASYPLALAALHGTSMTITNIGAQSEQADFLFLDVLQKMGCTIHKTSKSIRVKGPRQLKPLRTINLNKMPDAAMTVAVLCAFAKGRSKLTGLANLRVKETDRLMALAAELTKIGAHVKEGKDFLEIDGDPQELHGGSIETYNDHRMAMCFAVAGSRIPNIHILNPHCVQKTYPTFWKELNQWGIKSPSIKNRAYPNLILSGLRGSGKSTLGKKLAKKLSYRFVDTDELITEQYGPIPAIVEKHGWQRFRKLEAKVAHELSSTKKMVISTGGGMLINPRNTKNLRKSGYVALLKASPTTLAQRIMHDPHRPRLTKAKNLTAELQQLWQERRESYLTACDFAISTEGSTQSDIEKKANLILTEFKKLSG